MVAFGALQAIFNASELNGLWERMGEKGIRTRKNLEERLEGWTEAKKGEETESGEEDEIEYNARELKRLKPY